MAAEVEHQDVKRSVRQGGSAGPEAPAEAGPTPAFTASPARQFSPSQIAGLQRATGNAAVAGMLRRRALRGRTTVVARVPLTPTSGADKGHQRAVDWSHGWVAGVLRDIDALPTVEFKQLEDHAHDPDVEVDRLAVMLSAARTKKLGGANDWQLRDVYRQMQSMSMPEDQQQEVATFVGAFGLFTPKAINSYVKDVGDIFANWNDLTTAEQRAGNFGYLVNRQLGIQGIPPVAVLVEAIATGGSFDAETWTMTISSRLGRLDLTAAEQSDFIRRAAATFLHEARHAEQMFTMARARSGSGGTPAALVAELKIPERIAGLAAQAKLLPDSAEAKAAVAWYESEFGAGKAHREEVLGDLANRNDEYKALPEEADAHALGVAANDRLQGGVPVLPTPGPGAGGGLPGGIQRQITVQRAPEDPKAIARTALLARGLTLSDEDLATLITQFPKGDIALNPLELTLGGRSPTSAAAVKVPAIQILGLNYSPKTATYVFETGAGRAILVVGEGGASRLFDAGAIVGRISTGINFLVAAGLSKAPGVVKISHTDSDHLTDLQVVVESTGMQKPLVELTKQQLADPGLKQFARSRLTAVGGQVVEIDVSGEGMHVHREISGALRYIDIRWGPAQSALAGGGSKRQTNAGSPVSVVRDLLTGEVRVYTADSEPSTVMKMFDYIHPSALPYIFGAGQLKEFELPHHGGANTESRKTEAGRNYIRMLRLAYDASDGTTTFFAQTETEKLDQATNHVRVLHAAGFPVETVLLGVGPGGPGAAKIEGGVAGSVRLSAEEQGEIKAKVQPGESVLMTARKAGASVGQLRTALQIQLDAAETESPAVRNGIGATIARLDTEDRSRSAAVDQWWTALDAAVTASGGFNAKTDVGGCNAALDRLKQSGVMAPEKLLEYERTVQFQSEMMSATGRVAELALGMCDALLKNDVPRLAQLKEAQGAAYRLAVETMGRPTVDQALLEAWKAEAANLAKIQAQLLEMGQTAAKAQVENRLAAASMGALTNQMRAQEMINRASDGGAGIPRAPGGAVNQRARAGAGAMAALEVIRITLEVWTNISKGLEAAKTRAVVRQLRGLTKMKWWQDKGANPQVEIVDDSDRPLSPRLTDPALINKVLGGEKLDGYTVPEHPKIVVTGLTRADQMQVAMNLFLNANNLNEWHRVLNDARAQQDEENRPPIAVDDTGKQWAAYIWDSKSNTYVQRVDMEVSAFIDRIYKTCFDNSDAELKASSAAGGSTVHTVKATGWFSKTRDVWVYAQSGGLHKYTFPFQPALSLPKSLPSSGQVRAKAADAATYDFLRQFLWIVERPGAQDVNAPLRVEYEPNEAARCFVDVSDLAEVPAAPAPATVPG